MLGQRGWLATEQLCSNCKNDTYEYHTFRLYPDVVVMYWGMIVPNGVRWETDYNYNAYKTIKGQKVIIPASEHLLKLCCKCGYIPKLPFWLVQLLRQLLHSPRIEREGIEKRIYDRYNEFMWNATEKQCISGWVSGEIPQQPKEPPCK